MPDEKGVISCQLFIQHRKDPKIEHHASFAINSRSSKSITNQLYEKLLEIKKKYRLGNNYRKTVK